jgi:hypothetical protein
MMSPVGAALKKKTVKKIARKVATQTVNAHAAGNEGIFAKAGDGPTDLAVVDSALEATDPALLTLSVPAGNYAIVGKAWFRGTDNPGISCVVFAGGTQVDHSQTDLTSAEAAPMDAALPMAAGATLSSAGTIDLICASNVNGTATARDYRLMAIRAPSLA